MGRSSYLSNIPWHFRIVKHSYPSVWACGIKLELDRWDRAVVLAWGGNRISIGWHSWKELKY